MLKSIQFWGFILLKAFLWVHKKLFEKDELIENAWSHINTILGKNRDRISVQRIKDKQRQQGNSRGCEVCGSDLQFWAVRGSILLLVSIKSLVHTCWQCHLLEPLFCYWRNKTQQVVQKPVLPLLILKKWETLLMNEVLDFRQPPRGLRPRATFQDCCC